MSTFIIILLVSGFLLFVGGLLAMFIPGRWEIEEQVLVNAVPEKIFPLLNNPSKWPRWSVWSEDHDPSITFEYSETQKGLGATQSWKSGQVDGILTIIQSNKEESIQFHLALDGNNHIIHGRIRLAPVNLQTAVIWTTKFDVESFNPIKRLQSLPLKKLMLYNMVTSLEKLERVGEEL